MNQVDLEELIAQCYSPRAKTYLREAIDCYKVSAYRACVISTWIAVVFDIIDKLRELSLAGDSDARTRVQQFEEINEKRKIDEALEFERSILGIAQSPFEFLTAQEVLELSRLQEDRNRCAHPNLVREDDVYKPTPEMARAHLRSAVDILLKRPPVQGKAALAFLRTEVDSQYFPTTPEEAYEALKGSPLARAKRALIKEFLFGALTSCIKETLSTHKSLQRLAAVSAVNRLHPNIARELLKGGIDGVYTRLEDRYLGRSLFVLHHLPFLLPFLSEPTKQKLCTYVRNMPFEETSTVLCFPLQLAEFSDCANVRLQTITAPELKALINTYTSSVFSIPPQVVDRAITIYGMSASYDIANDRADDLIRPLVHACNKDQASQIIRLYSYSQVGGSYRYTTVVEELRAKGILAPSEFNQLLTELGIDRTQPRLLYPETPTV